MQLQQKSSLTLQKTPDLARCDKQLQNLNGSAQQRNVAWVHAVQCERGEGNAPVCESGAGSSLLCGFAGPSASGSLPDS